MHGLDLSRFDRRENQNMREVFGIKPDDHVIGMIARFRSIEGQRFSWSRQTDRCAIPKVKVLLVAGRSDGGKRHPADEKARIEPWLFSQDTNGGLFDTLACMDILSS